MENWEVESATGEALTEIKSQKGNFHGDSPFLFVKAVMSLLYVLTKYSGSYKFIKLQKINSLIHMDDIKIFTKNEKDLETLI